MPHRSSQICLLHFVKLLTCIVLVFFASSMFAQNIEEVVIQAEQQDTQTLDDLVSVSAISAEKLADAGIENVEDVAAYVPNLVLTQTETGTQICIRGICPGVNQGFDQSVGLYSDRVPLPRGNMARAPFLDLASVQVLRGPQYVLDGNYSIAGSVHMLSNLATEEFKAGIDYKYTPSQDDHTLLLKLGGPISEIFSVSSVFQIKQADGYIENVTRSENEPAKDELLGRLVFGFAPTDDLSFKLKLERGEYDTTGRAAEIIYAASTPVLNTKLAANSLAPGVPIIDLQRTATTQSSLGLATVFRNVDEWPLVPSTSLYWRRDREPLSEGDFLFGGKTYFQFFEDLYAINGATLPAGFTDTELNYKRGADAEEISENTSNNITLNTEFWVGDHRVTLTNSYIDYGFFETLDADFTALPLATLTQFEDYAQRFHAIEYKSPEGAVVEWTVGASHLNSDLSFTDGIDLKMDLDERIANGSHPNLTTPVFIEEFPLQHYLGRFNQDSVVGAVSQFEPQRTFKQAHELTAVLFQAKINWSDTFRSTLGMRYTYSEKSATRELILVDEAGNLPLENNLSSGNIRGLYETYAQILAIQAHSDQLIEIYSDEIKNLLGASIQETLDSVRREEKILPSITLEWDVSENLTLISSVRKANKLGGFDARSNTTPVVQTGLGIPTGTWEFEDEDATTYEIGAKWYLPNGFGEITTTAFLTDFSNLQTSNSDGRVGFNVYNAGAARSKGIEIEGILTFTERFNTQFSLAWLDFEFTDYLEASCGLHRRPDFKKILTSQYTIGRGADQFVALQGELLPIFYPDTNPEYERIFPNPVSPISLVVGSNFRGPFNGKDFNDLTQLEQNTITAHAFDTAVAGSIGVCNYNGQTNQFVADWQGTLTFNYETEIIGLGSFKPTLDVIYNSGYFTNITQDPDVAQDAFVQLNGRLALVDFDEIWEVALVGENLTNQKIVSYSQDLAFASGVNGARTYWGLIRPPRSIGINLRYNFY